MRMLGKRVAMTLGSVSIAAMMSGQVMAASLDASDMAFAFGGKAAPSAITRTAKTASPKAVKPVVIASARTMTSTEMQDTEGALAANLIGAGVGSVSAGHGYIAGGGSGPGLFIAMGAGAVSGFFSPVKTVGGLGYSIAAHYFGTYTALQLTNPSMR